MMNKKTIKTLFDTKQYDLVVKYSLDNLDPEVKLMGLSSLMLLGKEVEAITYIKDNKDILMSKYPLKTMRAHFELLLKNKLFKDAKETLKTYEEMPYISQEVEEFMRSMHERIEKEEHPNNKNQYTIDEICEILENSVSNNDLSNALFSLKDYNFSNYVSSLLNVLIKKDIHPSLRTYALIVLVDNKFDKPVSYLDKDKIITLIPNELEPPFFGEYFQKIVNLIRMKNEQNITLETTALQLYNYYIMDLYPSTLSKEDPELLSDALILLAKEYIGFEIKEVDKKVFDYKEKIKSTINSTPSLEL